MRVRHDILDRLVYLAVRLYCMVAQMFPINVNLRTARWLGFVWYRVMHRHRERAKEHLRFAFGSAISERQADRIARKSMEQMTMMAVELLFTPRLINEWTWARYIRLQDLREALEILLEHRGAILLTGHYGNWELLGFTLAALGFEMTAVMRPLDNPYLNDYLMAQRQKRGLQLLYKKGATRSAEDILNEGGMLCFIADQNAGHKGLFVDFFGRPASTYKSIGLLAIRHRVPIIVGYARRTSRRFDYEIGVNRIIRPHEWQGRADELAWITQEYTHAIETFVREAPEQYLWIHRRWKSRPRDERPAMPRLPHGPEPVPSQSDAGDHLTRPANRPISGRADGEDGHYPHAPRFSARTSAIRETRKEQLPMAGPNTLQFTDDNFEAEVLQSSTPVLVDFWAEWCGPCQRLGPTIDELATEYAGKVKVGKLDTDRNQHTAAQYGISSIPTVMVFNGGELAEKIIGLRNKRDYQEILNRLLG